MPTENIKFGETKIFMQDKNSDLIKELGNCECVGIEEPGDYKLDSLRYFAEVQKELSFTVNVAAEAIIKLKRALGIVKFTRKRFIKLLMGARIQRNDAVKVAEVVHESNLPYSFAIVQAVIKAYEERCKYNERKRICEKK